MMIFAFIALSAATLAFANGANDNFKGVATLFGSGAGSYRSTLGFATVATFAGSCAALVMAESLMKAFTGSGLVPADVASDPHFIAAVAFAAGCTVLLATRFGFPISTTHALTGALAGAGLSAAGGAVNFAKLGSAFLLPLAVSPLVGFGLALAIYPIFHRARVAMGVERESCICVSASETELAGACANGAVAMTPDSISMVQVSASRTGCTYNGTVAGVSAQTALNGLHYFSAGAVSFARGLNDTPKMAALLLAGAAFSMRSSLVAIAVMIALGGWLAARRVAETMSLRITPLNSGQGFTANLITSVLVIFAARWGLPVSTTHVSCGALFGIGATSGGAQWKTIGNIIGAWLLTLPIAAFLAGIGYHLLTNMKYF